MITVDEATRLIQATAAPLPAERVLLTEAAGRVLRAPVHADRDFPPFDRVTMDGLALRYAAVASGQTQFVLESTQFAGQAPVPLRDATAAIEIMTGAVLPPGTDTVVRYEDVRIEEHAAGRRVATLDGPPPAAGHNVHRRGSDRLAGNLLLPAGTVLGPAELAVAATVGAVTLTVARRPRVAVVSTGDELVDISEQPAAHQIRRSNAYMLLAAVQQAGAEGTILHFDDDPAALHAGLPPLLTGYDAVLLSGGVSKGKADYLPQALQQAGAVQLFHEVQQRPGKPFWFGRHPAGAVVFALPGNPVSTFVNYYRYAAPWLRAVQLPAPQFAAPERAALAADVTFKPRLTHFLLVSLVPSPDGRLLARPERAHGSGDLASLLPSDGFVELPAERDSFAAGEVLPVWRFRPA
ncbi:molybdopterin molybdotransferase MoeA [Hymenobacter sp. 15J16-1T3B]|uniref:molybdopterin molybdotransferase MoeA n=1 Tax=Hymenobacter sp. 15J16-1T3B TaxID=2886941 RepID=UPI001D124D9E|nr:molybdopterin molybdotransferase MoeA [Hymenobacter sp. 15J16-1T3B]MCC3159812.1 molybdopterin molybdotransferase MoeA [Hymenobacter sp. 15J16-1T3B]